MERVQVHLTEEQIDGLKKVEGVSMAEAIQQAVDAWLRVQKWNAEEVDEDEYGDTRDWG